MTTITRKASAARKGTARNRTVDSAPALSESPRAVRRVFEVEGKQVEVKGLSAFELLGFSQDEATSLLGGVVETVMQRRNGIKHELVNHLEEIAQVQHLTVTELAKEVAIARPRLSSIMNRDFDKVSIDAVVDVLHRLGKEVLVQVVDRERAVAAKEGSAPKTRNRKSKQL